MEWNAKFSDSWRTGATFVHDWGFLILLVVVIGHIAKALGEPTCCGRCCVVGAGVVGEGRTAPAGTTRSSTAPPSPPARSGASQGPGAAAPADGAVVEAG